MYRHASLGSAAPAFCVNYTAVRLYATAAWICVNNQQRKIAATAIMQSFCVKRASVGSRNDMHEFTDGYSQF